MEVQKDVGAHLILAQYLYTLVSAGMMKYCRPSECRCTGLAGTIAPCSLAFAALCQMGQSLLYEGCHQCSLPLCCLPACSDTQHAERISEQETMPYKGKQLLVTPSCATTILATPLLLTVCMPSQPLGVRSMLSIPWRKTLMCACAANPICARYPLCGAWLVSRLQQRTCEGSLHAKREPDV